MKYIVLFVAILSWGTVVSADENIFGEWVESETRQQIQFEFTGGGEDFQTTNTEAPEVSKITILDRKLVFKKDGTGTFRDSKFVRQQQDLRFSWLVVEGKESNTHKVFMSFEKPFKSEKISFSQARPLLVMEVKRADQDEIVVTSIKQNSPLGDRFKNIKLTRPKTNPSSAK